ncbi:MAG: tetratricopeptide repeat protein [Bacteroidales bacterium]|nr:tetratricopeptide repeat protein [Bacteroidales bacterium]
MQKQLFIIIIHCIFFIANCALVGAQSKIDSLKNVLKIAKDTNKVIILNNLAIEYREVNTDTAMKYATEGLDLGKKIGFYRQIAKSYHNIGIIYREQGKYIKALEYFEKSNEIFKELNYKPGIAGYLNSKGILYSRLGQIDKALNFYIRSLNIYDEIGEKQEIADLSNNIGTIYQKKEILDTALIYYNISLLMNKELGNISSIGNCYINIGEIYENQEKYDSAEYLYFESFKIFEKLENKRGLVNSNFYIGKYYNSIFEYQKALPYLIIAFDNAREVGTIEQVRNVAKELGESYGQLGQFKQAYYYQALFDSIDHSLNVAEMEKNITLAEIYYEIEKQNEIRDLNLKRQKLIGNFSMIAFGLALVLAFVIFRNYRIKNKANKLLAEMDQLKSRLFSNISHEFRTPLTLILGPIEEMLSAEKDKKPTRKAVKMMRRNANRLLNLVNQMLNLSKLDAGSLKLELVEKDIVRFLRVSILSFASLAEKKKINFIHKFPDEKLTTWYDPDKLEKILDNLLSNAFKFTPKGGEVKCEVKLPGPEMNLVEILVKDTGKGIPADQLDKVFDRFHQVKGSYEQESVGTGIGLSLTKELVNLLHGDIKVESELSKGTTFIVRLPVGKEHLKESEYTIQKREKIPKPAIQADLEVVTEGEESAEDLYQETKPEEEFPLVLTVEDHADIRVHIREHLEDSFCIMEAEDGVMGLDKAVENIPDLIITDLMMPKMDGVEMCKKLKTDERTSHIPVIMLTAKASVEDRVEGLETGADAYVTKPFNIKELEVRVRKLIEQRKKLRERFSREITLEPKDIAITSADEKFLQRAMAIVEDHMADFEFEVRKFQDEIGMSRMQLFRKLKALTDQTPTEFIRTFRLKRAAKLIEQKFGNIAQITFEVGFNNLSYFAKCFKELYGVTPSEYGKQG